MEHYGRLDVPAHGRARHNPCSTAPERYFQRSVAVLLSEPTDQASGGCGRNIPQEPGILSETDIPEPPSHLGEYDDIDRSETAAGFHGHFRHSGHAV